MPTTISQLTASITSSTGNDFLYVVDSGSLTSKKATIFTFNNWTSLSGSFASGSWASSSLFSVSSSFVATASSVFTSSVGLFINNTTPTNGTASFAISSSNTLGGGFALTSITASLVDTASFAQLAISTSNVFSTSYALFTPSAPVSTYTLESDLAITASYINLAETDINFQQVFGPFTASGFTSSRWGWTDPTERGVPIIVTENDTDIVVFMRAVLGCDGTSPPVGFTTVEVRWLPITESSAPGIYRTASYNDRLGTADDYKLFQGYRSVNGTDNAITFVHNYCHNLMFKKDNVAAGSYIMWVVNRMYIPPSLGDTILLSDRAHRNDSSTDVGQATGLYLLPENFSASIDNNQYEKWLYPASESLKAIIHSDKEVVQGIMVAPTSSMNHVGAVYNFHGNKNGNHGRNYILPFSVTAGALSAGYVSASCNFWSGSRYLSASFSASTSGLSVGDVVYATTVSLPAIANFFTVSVIVQGFPLSSVPIRTDISSSWIPFA